ncbi:MAG: OprO/OprP family phosphate-selective porin [Candidatus Scalindua sp.]|nr:OprO/OprP family phosphate-selective porin [Candidatus Scalindua sp.]
MSGGVKTYLEIFQNKKYLMRIVSLLPIVFFSVICTLFSCIHLVSAQSVSVPDLTYQGLCENTLTVSAPQRPIKTDNKYQSLQEDDKNRYSMGDSKSAKEYIPLYSPEIGKENPVEKEIHDGLSEISDHPFRIGYKNGLYLETVDNKFSLKTSLRLQLRYEIDDYQDKKDTSSLTIRRGRIALKGNAFGDLFTYFFQLDAHSTGKREISTLELIDYYTDINIIPFAKIRVGQGRVPTNRQWITPDSDLQMIDFSVASDEFFLDRKLGVMAHDEYFNKKLEYNLGIYTGNYILFDREFRDKNELLGIFRVSYNPFGSFGYSEGDFEFSKSPLAHLSGSVSFDNRDGVSLDLKKLGKVTSDNVESTLIEQEAGFKYKGFSAVEEFYWRRKEFLKERIEDLGWFVQGGYFVKPKKIETTLRYSQIIFDDDRKDETTNEETLGVNYFFSGHSSKIQFNTVRLHHNTVNDENTDYKFILQLQFTL